MTPEANVFMRYFTLVVIVFFMIRLVLFKKKFKTIDSLELGFLVLIFLFIANLQI